MRHSPTFRAIATGGLLAGLLAACAHAPRDASTAAPTDGARQLVLVVTDGWDATGGHLQRFERSGDGAPWRAVGEPTAIAVGRSGSGWGTGLHTAPADGAPVKREGDGRAPAGVFALGTAFGYGDADSVDSGLPYAAMDANDWCIDVPVSPLYNRIVSTDDVGAAAIEGSTEPMRRDLHADGDVRYKLGFVVEHNAANTPGGGSCIFGHLWRTPGEATAGCTAMAEPAMRAMLAWLDPAQRPVFVLLPAPALKTHADAWRLPTLAASP